MSESEISPLKQLSVLSKSLFKLLDEEFELLSGRDFLSVEKIQVRKVEKMEGASEQGQLPYSVDQV